uniref:Uncharacterized protein n=1 Tax=Arundo donax TaxID=35708 RepID=A0A0A9EH07_ARUDO
MGVGTGGEERKACSEGGDGLRLTARRRRGDRPQ